MSGRLEGRFIGLGVTGSVAAYKATELVRLLRAEGADVQVLLTYSAGRFVAPLTLAALSGHAVEGDVLDLMPDGRIGHIVIADAADAIVVAPATAHWLGAMANGMAGDTVTAACLATTAPVVVAPAMDGDMYAHPATQANVARLREAFGYTIVDPEIGPLASGQVGIGRLADLPVIVDAIVAAIGERPVRAPSAAARPPALDAVPQDADLVGRRVVVTAGGTLEPIDPVRFIGNRSTGRQGIAIAEAARDRGAAVTLIAAGISVPLPNGVEVVRVETTAELQAALRAAMIDGDGAPLCDALVMAAAVADFRPVSVASTKLDRGPGLTIQLEPTPDLLGELGAMFPLAGAADVEGTVGGSSAVGGAGAPLRPVLVGFAAETGSFERVAGKLRCKGVDLLVANNVSEPGSGFATTTNRVTVFDADGSSAEWPLQSKREVAERLLDLVVVRLGARDSGTREARRG